MPSFDKGDLVLSYELMYVVFGTTFLVGVCAYWWVTRLFADSSKTYESSNSN
jgi:hypothetical protein